MIEGIPPAPAGRHPATEHHSVSEQLKRDCEIQVAINSVLKISLEPISLEEQLQRTLDLILSIPWLSIQKKGCIFLHDEKNKRLVMKAQKGLNEALFSFCSTIDVGVCLCGKAAASREMIFADHVDEQHDVRYSGMLPHGHYCVPILSGDNVLGVFNIYVRDAHQRNGSEEAFLWAIADTLAGIIERKKTEEQLRTLSRVIEHIPASVVICTETGEVEYVNPFFTHNTGYPPPEILGRNLPEWVSTHGDQVCFENLWKAVTAGEIWTGHVVTGKSTGEMIDEEATAFPVRNAQGRVVNYIIVSQDVSRELQMEAQFRQAQKMEAIGLLAGGIAHDFNNLLTPIIGFTTLSMDEVPKEGTVYQDLAHVKEAAIRAKELVAQILTFSRQSEGEPHPTKLTSIVKEALKMLRSSLSRTITIRQDIHPDLRNVLADPTQIYQVLMNLCVNASHAMPEGGILTVALDNVDLHQRLCPSCQARLEMEDSCVQLVVKDTGAGMDTTVQERIFEPYFTTKKPGEGTGLGLAVVHGIVLKHGGHICVESEKGKGTSFFIYLPTCQTVAESQTVTVEQTEGGSESVLFVDDEVAILKLVKKMLERRGYRATMRSNGIEALELFKAKPEAFDLVITDYMMPGLTGDKLASELHALRPDLPVILCTGFSNFISPEKAEALGIDEIVLKPVLGEDLELAIRRVMEKRTTSKEGRS